jgi:hypothetical protein
MPGIFCVELAPHARQPIFYKALADRPPERPKYNWVKQHNDRRKFQEFTRWRQRVEIF